MSTVVAAATALVVIAIVAGIIARNIVLTVGIFAGGRRTAVVGIIVIDSVACDVAASPAGWGFVVGCAVR